MPITGKDLLEEYKKKNPGNYISSENTKSTPLTGSQLLENYNRIKTGIETENLMKSEDFEAKSGYVSTKSDNWWKELWSEYGLGYDDLTYEYINNQNGLRDEINSKYRTFSRDNMFAEDESDFEQKGYDFIEEQEVALYNYYYNTEGKDKAQEYLDSLEDTLVQRKAGKEYEALEGNTLKELFYGVVSGTDQWRQGIENAGDYLVGGDGFTSSSQYVSDKVRDDLADNGFKVLGSSVGQIGYDLINTTSNMLPSILVGAATGGFGGATALGVSAIGNAYSEMRRLGYDEDQSRAYATLVGASEIGLQYVLGGISKLGGKVSGKAISNLVSRFDNALARGAITLGGSMASEGLEEGLQTILEPAFKALVTGEDFESPEWEEIFYSAVLGALSAGALEGPVTIRNTVRNIKSNLATGKIYGDSVQDLLVDAVNTGGEAGKVADKLIAKYGKKGKLSGANLNELIHTTDTTKLKLDIDAKLTEHGETGNISAIADILVRQASGEKLSSRDWNTLNKSKAGHLVSTQLNEKNIMSGALHDDWATYTGTERLNPKVYNRNVYNIAKLMQDMGDGKKLYNMGVPDDDKGAKDVQVEVSDNGKNMYYDAEAKEYVDADIKSIVSTNGGIKVELENGKTVSASDLAFASREEGVVYEMLARMGVSPETANEIINTFKPSNEKQADLYFDSIPLAYRMGLMGNEQGLKYVNLTDAQKRLLYNRGRIDAVTNAKERDNARATSSKKATAKVSTEKGIIFENGFVYDEASASELQRMGMARAEAIAKTTNLEVHVFDSKLESDANGYFKDGNKIYINLSAGMNAEGAMLYALSHEVTHYIRKWNAQGFKDLADFLFAEYGKHGVDVTGLISRQKDKIKKRHIEEETARIKKQYEIEGKAIPNEAELEKMACETLPSDAKLFDMAYEELVADAMSDMLADPKAYEKLAKFKKKNFKAWKKLGEIIKELLDKLKNALNIYRKDSPVAVEALLVRDFSQEVYDKLQDLYIKAFVEADANYEAAVVSTDPVAVEDTVMYSYSSLAEAAGFIAEEREDGSRSFIRDGKAVSKVTVEDIENSPIGAFINYSLDKKDIDKAQADRQKQMFADICTMACKTNDFSMAMQFVGSAVFTGMKANADKQYGTTYDFPSICTKTQAVIDAMSARMVKLGRGLNSDEIVKLYRDVFASGNPVPCPECYVFSRWIGIGGLLDNIKKYQDYYGKMSIEEVSKAYKKMRSEVEAFAEANDLSFGKAKGALTAKLTKEYNKLSEKIEKATNQGEAVKESDRKRLKDLEPMMNTVKSMTWLENVYFADSSLTKVNKNYKVPNEVLFDLNNGEAFATQYPEAWAFRTTQGAGYGKAITPYAEAKLGEGVLVTNNTTNAIKEKAKGTLNNYFLQQKGKMDATARKALDNARAKQKNQAFLGGQRFQSTSDARYENASDYLLAALEMQAMRGMVQVYTKVDGAVPAFATWGFSINQSLMPPGGGIDADGNVKDTSVGGMNPKVAFKNRANHESAGTITIGVNDNHIRAMYPSVNRDFVIPYHASGGKADVVAEFRTIQDVAAKRNAKVRSTDYSRTRGDKVLSDDVLRWLGKTDAEIENIHKVRAARIAILTRGKVDMDVVRGNRFLSALYDKFHGGEWDGVKLAKSKVESQIYPNEFWDQSVSYEDSGKVTKDYLEYCDDLGFLHRFSGLVPSNGKLVSVNGYDQNGNRVKLTDLAYKYENGQKTDVVEDFYWKLLTDRRMYDNNGNYLPQKIVTLNDTSTDTVTEFAKNNDGRQYDKAVSLETANEIAETKYSDRDTDAVSNRTLLANALESTAQNDIEKNKLAQYKQKIALIESEQAKLDKNREEAKELRFKKGRIPSETKRLHELDAEATQLANRISTYDKQLLNLESTKALKNVLEREKTILRKSLEKQGKEALNAQRAKNAETVREIMTRNTESRHKAVEGRHKTEVRGDIKKLLQRLNKLFKGGKERNVKEGMKEAVSTALALGDILFSNEISNLDIVNLGVESVTEKESKHLDEYRDLLMKKESNLDRIRTLRAGIDVDNKEQTYAYISELEAQNRKYDRRMSELNGLLSDVFTRERARLNRMPVNTLIDELASEYQKLKSEKEDYIKVAYDSNLYDMLVSLKEKLDGVIAKDMSLEQLGRVKKVFTMLEHSIRTANQEFRNGKWEDLQQSASAVMEEIETLRDIKQEGASTTSAIRSFLWNELAPYYAFDKIGSKTLMAYFKDLMRGQAIAARDSAESKAFAQATREKYNYSKWKLDEIHEFQLNDGRTFRTTLKHLLSVYAYSKREQADLHMSVGGFFHNDKATFRKKKGVLKMVRTDAVGYKVDANVLAQIKATLGNEKMAYVDEMLDYLTKMGEKGNEVTRVMWGVDIFTEKVYFPLKSKEDFLKKSTETAQAVSLKNDGMTKETVPGASNPIVLEAFDEVWANHVERMSVYHGFVIPIDNLNKVLHYGTWVDTDAMSVSTMLEGKFTSAATDYLEQFIKDLNGGAVVQGATNPFMSFFAKFKKTAVGASLSTVVQQPTAIIRAMAEIDAKYFVGKPHLTKLSERLKELKTYAPIAIIKEIGGFDAGGGSSIARWINSDTLTGIDKVMNTIDDISMKGAEYADWIGWLSIWEAVKRETKATTNLEYDSKEFLDKCGERFEEVIMKTQVYDSTLSRSGFMRSKNDGVKMLTSFMGEPTLSINMLYSAVINAMRGGKEAKLKAAKTIGYVYLAMILAEALSSAIYALRDDDEDESYMEKYLQSLGSGAISDIVLAPVTSLPGVKDIVSIFQGWDVERSDMAIFKDIKDAFDGLDSESKSPYRKVEDFAGAIASAFGVPLKNVLRTGREVYNAGSHVFDDVSGGSAWDAFKEGVTGKDTPKGDSLYDAIVNGDKSRLAILKKSYKTERAFETAMRQALRDNDSRIKKAAQARYEGDIAEYTRIAKEIIREGNFSQDIVVGAINAEMNAIKRGETIESESTEDKDEVTSIYSGSDINSAFDNGDSQLAQQIIADLIETKVANGMEEKDAKSSLRSSMTSYWKPLFKQAYKSGNNSEMARIRRILYASGLYGTSNDVVKTTQNWLKS